jgi:nicotinamide riboside kinase
MPIKIVVTGPESTGKTTLCSQLARYYKGTMIPEFSRMHLEKSQGYYQMNEIEEMAIIQNTMNNASSSQKPLFCDTDALNYYIWLEFKYKIKSSEIQKIIRSNPPDLYLLCFPDLPWEYDPLRENPFELEELFKVFLWKIHQLQLPYALVYGIGRQRFTEAVFIINNRFPELITFVS